MVVLSAQTIQSALDSTPEVLDDRTRRREMRSWLQTQGYSAASINASDAAILSAILLSKGGQHQGGTRQRGTTRGQPKLEPVQEHTPRKPQRPKEHEPKPHINFFIWQGWGWLVPIIYLGSVLAIFVAMNERTNQNVDAVLTSKWMVGTTLLLPPIFVGLFGLWTNKRRSARLRKRVSKFLLIRSEIWALPLIIVGIAGMVFIDNNNKRNAAVREFMSEGRAALSEKQLKIDEQASARSVDEFRKATAKIIEANRNATYSLTLCNDTNKSISAAVALKSRGSARYMRMRSWYNIGPRACLKPFVRRFDDSSEGISYIYGKGEDGKEWGGNSGDRNTIDFCLFASSEDFLIDDGLRCRSRARSRTFQILTLTRETRDMTYSFR